MRSITTTLGIALLLSACGQRSATTTPTPTRPDAPALTIAPEPALDAHTSEPSDACTQRTPDPQGIDLLDLAHQSGTLATTQAQRCLASLGTTEPRPRRSARLFLLARRLPVANLAAFWDAVRIDERDLVMRAAAGRAAADGQVRVPVSWERTPERDLMAATLADRLRIEHEASAADADIAARGLGAAAFEQQLATARWLRMVAWRPTLDDLAMVTPPVVPALVRSLSSGPSATTTPWNEWIALLSRRARVAPRIWGNAWRALRDAAPKAQWQANATTWITGIDALPRVRGLEGEALARFECEDAMAIDRWLNRIERTTRCASGSEQWISLAQQAELIGEIDGQESERGRMLTALKREAANRPAVLTAIATAAAKLPRVSAIPLLTALARERDAAVLAAVLEGLTEHPVLARALDASVRDALIRAPFEAPEGPMLEARLGAIKLARLLHRDELIEPARTSTVRAVQEQLLVDGGVLAPVSANAVEIPPLTRVRFVTDAGSFVLEFDSHAAPRAVANVRSVVQQRRYDGLRWHRIVPGFVVQGGDPRGDGYGGTETPIWTELSLGAFERGAIGIPLSGLDTGGMQLFVVTGDAPHLDGRYPWAGRVIRGMDVLDGILPGDRIVRAEFVER